MAVSAPTVASLQPPPTAGRIGATLPGVIGHTPHPRARMRGPTLRHLKTKKAGRDPLSF